MNQTGQPLPLEEMVQPCSEACRHFVELATDPWGDHGVCRNPRTPVCGYPVKSDRDCRWYEPTTTRR